jgi:hypothetical protein
MPHRRLDLLAFARRFSSRVMLPAMLLALLAVCRRDSPGTTIVVLDSTSTHDTLEVVALPIDPSTLEASLSPSRDAATERGIALRDSSDTVDARFQRLRDTLNDESRAMQHADRRSPEYHRRFDDWRRRMLTADSLRASRDRMRARITRAGPLPSPAKSTVRATLLALTAPDGRHAMVRTVAVGDSVTLDLGQGEWWIGAMARSGAPSGWRKARPGRLLLRP